MPTRPSPFPGLSSRPAWPLLGSPLGPGAPSIVGEGDSGGKIDQGGGDDDPGCGQEEHEQRINDEAVPARMGVHPPKPLEGPGALL